MINKSTAGLISTRYITRKNMVLTSISWTQNQFHMPFTMSFDEVMMADILSVPVLNDSNLPSVLEPSIGSFDQTFSLFDTALSTALQVLLDEDLITLEFLEAFQNSNIENYSYTGTMKDDMGAILLGGLASIGAAATGGGTLALVIAGAVAGVITLTATGILVIVAVTVAAAIWVYSLVYNNVQSQKYKISKFDNPTPSELQRFYNWCAEMAAGASALNDQFIVYEINPNSISESVNADNIEILTSIDGGYYSFNFNRNNDSGFYNLNVLDMNDVIQQPGTITNIKGSTDLFNVDKSEVVFVSPAHQYEVYVFNKEVMRILQSSDNIRERKRSN